VAERDKMADGHKDLLKCMSLINEICEITGKVASGKDVFKVLKSRVVSLVDDKRLMTGHLQKADQRILELESQLEK
jgi:hypothetical protein